MFLFVFHFVGLDFSSRWFINDEGKNVGSLKDLKTRSIIPVELNAILFWNARIISEFYGYAGNATKQKEYMDISNEILKAVEEVLWNEEEGAWLDYDIMNNKSRPFFVSSNLAPLWMNCYDPAKKQHIADRIVDYIERMKLDDYPGGELKTNLYQTNL